MAGMFGEMKLRVVSLFKMAHNVPTLGEEADLEAQTFSLAKKPIGSTNVQFSTKTAFLPNLCWAIVLGYIIFIF